MRRIWRSIIILGFGIRILVGAEPPQGFFLYDFQPKKATIPTFREVTLTLSRPTVTVEIEIGDTLTKVPQYIYGHNANVYMTQMVNEPTLIGYLKQLAPQILRYPGGNLSNLFFWNNRPSQLPEDVPDPLYGGVEKPYREEFWFGRNDTAITLSVDNYYKMLEMTNCSGLICVNYSYARYGKGENPVATAAKYAADWVRYDNGRTKYWEIGNENFGNWQAGYKINTADNKDGQPEIITGELYGQHFKVFADSMRAAARSIGAEIKLGAGLLESAHDWHTPTEKTWNSGFFKQAGDAADFFVIHSYYTPWNENSSAGTILNSAIPVTQEMMTFMQETARINEVKMKPVGLTEWNIFAVGSKQQVSY
ncbi:MAG TPA: alpha-L-arabinofuranosidase, partial [Candidatus Marinimicrobia bacterium]|nr:alpha-L-arabinofuranosidase [Candidatus Neomarinimicrobiota bacterium]